MVKIYNIFFLILFSGNFSSSNCFVPFNNVKSIKKNKIIETIDYTKNINNLNNLNNTKNTKQILFINNPKKTRFNNTIMLLENDICPDYLNMFAHMLDIEKNEFIVKFITSFLTKVDGFGGYVLHTNDIIINHILNNNYLDLEIKKKIILFFIKLSQYGDSTGSHILKLYYDLVNCLLHS